MNVTTISDAARSSSSSSSSSSIERLNLCREEGQRDDALQRQSSLTTRSADTDADASTDTATAASTAGSEAIDCNNGPPSGNADTITSDHCSVAARDPDLTSSHLCSTSTCTPKAPNNKNNNNNNDGANIMKTSKNKYTEEFNNRDNEKPLKSVLAAACKCVGFDIAEMWLQTGPTTHQLIHCYLNDGTHSNTTSTGTQKKKEKKDDDDDDDGSDESSSRERHRHCPSLSSSIDEKTRLKLREVYQSKDAPYKVHTLSPALCKKARQVNAIIHISTETDSGSKALLESSLCDVVYAAAVPVKYIGHHHQQQQHHNRHGYGDRTFLNNFTTRRKKCHFDTNGGVGGGFGGGGGHNKPRLETIEEDSFQPNTNLTVIYFSVRRQITVQPSTNEFLNHLAFAAVDLGMNFFVNHPNHKKTREGHHHHHHNNNKHRHHKHHVKEEKNDNDDTNTSTSSTSSNNSGLSYSSSSSGSDISYEDYSNHKSEGDIVASTPTIDDGIELSLNDNCCMKNNRVADRSSRKARKTRRQIILGPVQNDLDHEEQQGCIRVRQAAVGLQQQVYELGSGDSMSSNDDSARDDFDSDNDFDNIVLAGAKTNDVDDDDDDGSTNNDVGGLRYRSRSKSMGCLQQN